MNVVYYSVAVFDCIAALLNSFTGHTGMAFMWLILAFIVSRGIK